MIGTRQLLGQVPDTMTFYQFYQITPVSSAKDLGMSLDNNLTYDHHMRNLVSSSILKLCQINRVRYNFGNNTIRTTITALVMSKLYYCSIVWSNTSTTNTNTLQAVQNFAVRIITNTRKYDHITPALNSIRWLPAS